MARNGDGGKNKARVRDRPAISPDGMESDGQTVSIGMLTYITIE